MEPVPLYYFLNHDCAPRTELGSDELARCYRDWVLADQIREQFDSRGQGNIDPEKMIFKRSSKNLDGRHVEQDTNVAELEDHAKVLMPLATHCAGCLASVTGNAFGCIQNIPMPIKPETEEWLVSMLPQPGTPTFTLWKERSAVVPDEVIEQVQAWRKVGFFRNAKALPIPGGEENSDVLLGMLLNRSVLDAKECLAISLLFNLLETSEGKDSNGIFQEMRSDAESMSWDQKNVTIEFKFPSGPEEFPDLYGLKLFFYSCFKAFSLGTEIHLRPEL